MSSGLESIAQSRNERKAKERKSFTSDERGFRVRISDFIHRTDRRMLLRELGAAKADEHLILLEMLQKARGQEGALEEFNRFLDWLPDSSLSRELARIRDRQDSNCRLPVQ